jgi:ribosomal protein L37AE/L43A
MQSDLLDVTASDYCRELAAAKEAVLLACMKYNKIGSLSGSYIDRIRFASSASHFEELDLSARIRSSICPKCGTESNGLIIWEGPVWYCEKCQEAFSLGMD